MDFGVYGVLFLTAQSLVVVEVLQAFESATTLLLSKEESSAQESMSGMMCSATPTCVQVMHL